MVAGCGQLERSWPVMATRLRHGEMIAPGNVGHAPAVLAAQFVAAVPPVSAALTFHLLLRLLDRAPVLRAIAESYDERSVDEQVRAAARKARRAGITTGRSASRGASASADAQVSGNGHPVPAAPSGQHHVQQDADGHRDESSVSPPTRAARTPGPRSPGRDELSRQVRAAVAAGEPVNGETVGGWLGLSARTGRRRLADLLNGDPELARLVNHHERS